MPWTASLTSPCNPDRIVSQPVGTFPCRPVFFCPLSTFSLTPRLSPRASLLATPSASPPPALLTIFMSWQWVNIPVAYVLPVEDSSSISSFSKRRTRYVDIIIRLSKRRASLFRRLKAGLTCSSFATQRKTRNGTEIVFPQVNIGLRGVHP